MPKQLRPRERLALHIEERRLDLDMRWADVAAAAGVTTETLRQVRSGDGDIRPLTKRAIESALQWKRGSINAVLAGGEPEPDPDAATSTGQTPPASGDGDIRMPSQTGTSDATIPDVAAAIREDDSLIEEAKIHLLNQYELLRRLSVPPATKDPQQPKIPADPRPLRAVARKRPPRTP